VGGIDLFTGAADVSREQPYVLGLVPLDRPGEPGVQLSSTAKRVVWWAVPASRSRAER
jgi:hypothetical protein